VRSRLVIAIPGIALAVAAVALGGVLLALVLAAVAVVGLYEFYGLTAAARPLRWAGYAGVLLAVILAWAGGRPEHDLLLALAAEIGLVAVAALMLPHREEITQRIAVTLLGAVYLGLPLATLMLTRRLPDGAAALANIVVGTWVFDTASYVGGRLWGRNPIAPLTSPGKTIEGFVCGLVVGTFAVWWAGLYEDWIRSGQSLLLGVVICLAAYLGDLFESLLKRDAHAKDSSKLLLGHGGVLDRFDALLFAGMAGYFTTVWLVH
jgi:phosphatidate cytidylyltransferase